MALSFCVEIKIEVECKHKPAGRLKPVQENKLDMLVFFICS